MDTNLNQDNLKEEITEKQHSTGMNIYLKSVLIIILTGIMFIVSQIPLGVELMKMKALTIETSIMPDLSSNIPTEFIEYMKENPFTIDMIVLVSAILIIGILFLIYRKLKTVKTPKFTKKTLITSIVLTFGILIFKYAAVYIFYKISGGFTENDQAIMGILGAAPSIVPFALIISFFAPITEELMFRGFLFEAFAFKNKYIPLIITSAIFAVLHLGNDYTAFPLYFGMGLFLGYAYMKTNNILVPIILHIVNNGIGFIPMLLEYLFK